MANEPDSYDPLTPAELHILLALADGEQHGYAIMQEISACTGGRFRIGPGTLYGTIKRLLSARLISAGKERTDRSLSDERRRYYRLSNSGRRVLAPRCSDWPSSFRSRGKNTSFPRRATRPRAEVWHEDAQVAICAARSDRVYRWLVLFLPAAFRREYGEPMAQLFRDCCRLAFAKAGYPGLAWLWCRTCYDLICSAIREHVARGPILVKHCLTWPVRRLVSSPLTPRAKKSLEIAVREAAGQSGAAPGPEHIVLGLIEEGSGVAGQVLIALSINAAKTRQAALAFNRPLPDSNQDADFVRVLVQRARAEARRLGHPYVGTEHLLLGLLKADDVAASALLNSMGISVAKIEQDILRIIAAAA